MNTGLAVHVGNVSSIGSLEHQPIKAHRVGTPFREGVYGRWPDWMACRCNGCGAVGAMAAIGRSQPSMLNTFAT